MRFDPPLITRGPLSGSVYVVTHGTRAPDGRVNATTKYDITAQLAEIAEERIDALHREFISATTAYNTMVRESGAEWDEAEWWRHGASRLAGALFSAPSGTESER